MGGLAPSTIAKIYMQVHERTAISTALHPPEVWERVVSSIYSIIRRAQLQNLFHQINSLHQNIKFTMEEERNEELAFAENSLKVNKGKISVFVYRKPTPTSQYLHYSNHHQASCKESVNSQRLSQRKH